MYFVVYLSQMQRWSVTKVAVSFSDFLIWVFGIPVWSMQPNTKASPAVGILASCSMYLTEEDLHSWSMALAYG
jgi:hypothetical protein